MSNITKYQVLEPDVWAQPDGSVVAYNHNIDMLQHNPPIPERMVVKVPEKVYQILCDLARVTVAHTSEHGLMSTRRLKVYLALKEWVEETYPGYGIWQFEDFNAQEAEEMSRKTGRRITWGMYLLLKYGVKSQLMTVTYDALPPDQQQLPSSKPQLE